MIDEIAQKGELGEESPDNEIVWEFKCSCGFKLELPASETDFAPTRLGLPECEDCGKLMRHVGPVLDECDRCGTGLLYHGNSGLGHDTLCDGCFEKVEAMM